MHLHFNSYFQAICLWFSSVSILGGGEFGKHFSKRLNCFFYSHCCLFNELLAIRAWIRTLNELTLLQRITNNETPQTTCISQNTQKSFECSFFIQSSMWWFSFYITKILKCSFFVETYFVIPRRVRAMQMRIIFSHEKRQRKQYPIPDWVDGVLAALRVFFLMREKNSNRSFNWIKKSFFCFFFVSHYLCGKRCWYLGCASLYYCHFAGTTVSRRFLNNFKDAKSGDRNK